MTLIPDVGNLLNTPVRTCHWITYPSHCDQENDITDFNISIVEPIAPPSNPSWFTCFKSRNHFQKIMPPQAS